VTNEECDEKYGSDSYSEGSVLFHKEIESKIEENVENKVEDKIAENMVREHRE
jgi:hypothetical protein